MADPALSALSTPPPAPTNTGSAGAPTVTNKPEGQTDTAALACLAMARLRLLGIRMSQTQGGIEFEPELTHAGLRQWILANSDAALTAQQTIESAVVTTTHLAATLYSTIQALNEGQDLQPEVKLSLQAKALKLADSIGWPFALALSTWAWPVFETPTSGATLRTGMYL